MVKASDVVLILVAILFPPAAALVVTGCSCDLLINLLLTMYVFPFLSFVSFHSFAWLLLQLGLFTRTYSRFLVDLQEDAGRREVWRWWLPLYVFHLSFSLVFMDPLCVFTDLGSGHYEPLYQSDPYPGQYSHSSMPAPYAQDPQYYGATPQYQ